MKKLIIAILSLIMLFAFAGACGETKPSEPTPTPEQPTVETLNTITLDLYSDYSLPTTENAKYSSTDSTVVSVDDNGGLIAYNTGTVEIFVDEGKTQKYVVTVEDNGIRPVLSCDDLSIQVRDKYILSPKLSFNGKTYSDVAITFAAQETDVITLNAQTGEITANKTGTATVVATTSWRGVSSEFLTKEITVNAIASDSSVIVPSRTSVHLYTTDSIEELTFPHFETINVEVADRENNFVALNSENFSVAAGSDEFFKVVPTENGAQIIGRKAGESTVTFSYTDKDDAQNNISYEVKVKVDLAIKRDNGNYRTETYQNSIIPESIKNKISDFTEILDITGDRETAVYANGVYDASAFVLGERSFRISNGTYAYEFDSEVISKAIYNKEDFLKLYDYFTVTNDEVNKIITLDGYVLLEADLDFSDYDVTDYKTYPVDDYAPRKGFGWESYLTSIIKDKATCNDYINVLGYGSNIPDNCIFDGGMNSLSNIGKSVANLNGFVGTFDGQGHTIKGLRIAHGGLFPTIGKTGVIKNVAFADTTLGMAASTFGALFAGTLDNVFVDIAATAEGSYANCGIAKALVGTVKNSVLYMINTENLTENDANGGIVANRALAVSGISRDVWTGFYVFADGSNNKFYFNVENSEFDGTNSSNKIFFSDTADFAAYTGKKTGGYNVDIWDFETYDIPVFKTYNGYHVKFDSRISATVEAALGAEIALDGVEGVKSVKSGNKDVAFTFEDGKLKIDAEALKAVGFGEVALNVEQSNGRIIIINATIYSKVIRTADEFLNLFNYLTVTGDATNGYVYDGYIALGANIDLSTMSFADFASSAYNYNNNQYKHGFGWLAYSNEFKNATLEEIQAYWQKVEGDWPNNGNLGFVGTIDGFGYTVKGLKMGQLGMFPQIGSAGVIKNIAFVDMEMAMESYGFALVMHGSMDNCLIDVMDTESNGSAATAIAKQYKGSISNSIIRWESEKTDSAHFSVLGLKRTKSVTNSYIILGVNAGAETNPTIGLCGTEYKQWFTYNGIDNYNAKLASDGVNRPQDYSKFDKNIWDFDSHVIPVFKTYNGTNIAEKTVAE